MTMRHTLLAATALCAGLGLATLAHAAGEHLSGAIASSAGEKLGGVTVSAKAAGSTITTSVYTDDTGNYYFPPLPAGKYRVWAQALGFERANADVDLSANKRQALALKPIADPERRWRQLPAEDMVQALPEATPDDARIKNILINQCTGCHTLGHPLTMRFDEAGWNKIINLMKVISGNGVYRPGTKPNQIIDMNQKQLAAYLARVRGPGEPLKVKTPPRPSGESARVVWTLYDVPRVAGVGIGDIGDNDGTDWASGAPSKLGLIMHDGQMDFDGNLWFTSNSANTVVTVGRIDAKTGEVTYRKLDRPDGRAASTHGLTRDANGNLWFDINPGRRGLGKLEPKTGKITVYPTPDTMPEVSGAVTIDIDGKGKIWLASADGVLRFDPVTAEFTDFKDSAMKRPNGNAITYGAAGDRDGNGWWAEMAWDTIGKADPKTGKSIEIVLPEKKSERDRFSPEQLAAYDKVTDISTGSPYPWSQGPRRMGTDKNADVLWVGDSWGSTLARIDTKTNQVTMVPMPQRAMQPYHIFVDSKHNVWGNLWTADEIFRYDPAATKWTTFALPVRGTEIRHISVDERSGALKVILPVYRTSQMAVMTMRSDSDIAALKAAN